MPVGNKFLRKIAKTAKKKKEVQTPKTGGEGPTQASEAVGKAPEASATQAVEKAPESAPAATTTGVDAEQLTPEQEKLIESIDDELLHSTEVKEPSGAQVVKEDPELKSETPGTSAEGSEAAPEAQKAQTKPDDVRSRKTGGMNEKIPGRYNENYKNFQVTGTKTKEQPTVGTGDGTQTPNAGTKTPDEKQAAQSGGGYNPAEFMEKAKDQNLGSSERQMLKRLGNMRKNALEVFDNGTGEQIKNELGRWGIEAEDGATTSDYMNKIDEMLKSKAESGPTIGDKFRAHHGVGLTGLGVVGVSTLDLANSRGQQSNAQLYSDPFA